MILLALLVGLASLGSSGALEAAGLVAEPQGGELAPTGPRYEIARVLPGKKVELLDAPDGELVERLGAKTEFNSPRTFHVAERSDGWLGVLSPELANAELGWISDDPELIDVYETSYSIDADLSAREVELRWGTKTITRFPVTVGRAGSETPPGTYSVTDGLTGRDLGSYYGCCVLALSGHQPDLPADWIGGDRIAIHGTPGSVGGAASLGCLRASDRDMVALFALVPLGTPVFIRS